MLKRYPSAAAITLLTTALALATTSARAQDDLLGDLEKPSAAPAKREVVQATFKGTHIINSQSVETEGAGTLGFVIQHRFGRINQGFYDFFGLDQAALRLGFEYGLTNKIVLGFGRSSAGKTYDGSLKYRAVRQTTGAGAVPVSVTLFAGTALMTERLNTTDEARATSSRLSYVYQGLIARKFSPELSVQLMPTLVHRNYVAMSTDKNDVYAIGAGFRQKITKRLALTGDYFFILPSSKPAANSMSTVMRNPLGVGVDIETGGHVFQLHLSNSQSMTEAQFIPQTTGKFFSGDIYFGFAIARNFTVKSNLN